MDWNWLISPIAGSIIGYGTNYLAIKMLFRPHNAKYIGKIKIPFTPGLIPKEKRVLAKKIGETVEEHLLSEDILVETLTSPKAREAFYNLIDTIPGYMETSNQTIGELAQHMLGTDMEQNLEIVVNQLTVEILTTLRSQEVMDSIIPHIIDGIGDMIDKNISNIINHEDMIVLFEKLGNRMLESEGFKDYMRDYLQDLEDKLYNLDTSLLECIPLEYINWLNSIIMENSSYIAQNIIQTIAEGEEAERIKALIQSWAEQNFNPMVLMFIKIDKIYEGIINFSKTSLEDEANSQRLGELLCKIIRGLLQQPPSAFLKNKENMPDYKNAIINILQSKMNKINIQEIVSLIHKELLGEGGIQKIIKTSHVKSYLEQWIYNRWDGYMNTETAFALSKRILEELFDFIRNTPIANLSMLIPVPIFEQIRQGIFKCYTKIITSHSKTIAKVMDISTLVEMKINEFSSEEAEDIIISVVNSQLQGITWLGALLGFIIGIIPNFIG